MIRRFSLLTLLGGVLVALAAISVFATFRVQVSSLQKLQRADDTDQVRMVKNAIEADLREEIRHLRVLSRVLKHDHDLDITIARYQRDPSADHLLRLREVVKARYARSELSTLGLVDRDGKVLYRAHQPDTAGDKPTDWGIAEALDGHETLASEVQPNGTMILNALPLLQGDAVVGALKVGIQIDDRFAAKIASEFGIGLSFANEKGVIASSLPTTDRGLINLGPVRKSLKERAPVYQHDSVRQRTIVYDPQQLVDETLVVIIHLDQKASYTRISKNFRELAYLLVGTGVFSALFAPVLLYWLAIRPFKRRRTEAKKISRTVLGPAE